LHVPARKLSASSRVEGDPIGQRIAGIFFKRLIE
jgi:hypothetical protein